MVGRNFFKINGSWDIYLSLIFWFQKTVLHHKIINKTWLTKYWENSTQCFGDNYLTDHLLKSLQEWIKPRRVGALGKCTGYHFL